jgi:hypothetical protein
VRGGGDECIICVVVRVWVWVAGMNGWMIRLGNGTVDMEQMMIA